MGSDACLWETHNDFWSPYLWPKALASEGIHRESYTLTSISSVHHLDNNVADSPKCRILGSEPFTVAWSNIFSSAWILLVFLLSTIFTSYNIGHEVVDTKRPLSPRRPNTNTIIIIPSIHSRRLALLAYHRLMRPLLQLLRSVRERWGTMSSGSLHKTIGPTPISETPHQLQKDFPKRCGGFCGWKIACSPNSNAKTDMVLDFHHIRRFSSATMLHITGRNMHFSQTVFWLRLPCIISENSKHCDHFPQKSKFLSRGTELNRNKAWKAHLKEGCHLLDTTQFLQD